MKKCIVIYNPSSGKFKKIQFHDEFIRILKEHGYECEFIFTKYAGHATDIVRETKPVDLVISIGGDGTFNETMTGNFQRKNRLLLAHIPFGTTNDIGKMLGYEKDIITNLELTLSGTIKDFDICTINKKPFIYVAAIGKFTNIPYETTRSSKKRIGYLAYIKEGVKSFFRRIKLYEIEYEVNGEKYRGYTSFLIISSANRIAGIDHFYKDVKLDDDKFEVLLCSITKKSELLKSMFLLTMYDASKVPGIEFYKTNNMKIKFITPLRKSWCIDGEELKDRSKEFEIKIVNKVKILVPSKNTKELFIK